MAEKRKFDRQARKEKFKIEQEKARDLLQKINQDRCKTIAQLFPFTLEGCYDDDQNTVEGEPYHLKVYLPCIIDGVKITVTEGCATTLYVNGLMIGGGDLQPGNHLIDLDYKVEAGDEISIAVNSTTPVTGVLKLDFLW